MACGQIDAQTAFSLPAVPDTLRTAEKRAAYLLVHYWDSMDFNWPDVKSAEVEQAFADFASVLPVGTEEAARAPFARALVDKLANFSFEEAFAENYDFFSNIFEYLIKDYNTAGGGKYAEEKNILQKIVEDKIVYGCVSMPSNVFANTGTNVSVLFFDKSASADKVILIDASKLGEEYKDANGLKKVRLSNDEIERIVTTFLNKEAVDDFSVAVTYDEIKEKGYSLSAGQYFDIKIDYVDITEEEFNQRMTGYKQALTQQFEESHRLEEEIMKQLESLGFNNVTR